MTLANAPHWCINGTNVSLGGTTDPARNLNTFNGFSLARAIVEALRCGYEGIEGVNVLTGTKCVYRTIVAGIRCDAPMVSEEDSGAFDF